MAKESTEDVTSNGDGGVGTPRVNGDKTTALPIAVTAEANSDNDQNHTMIYSNNNNLNDGVDGDDERDDDEDDCPEEEEEEDDEEEEEEPQFKYQKMGGSISTVLHSDAASCITVSDRMIALGTLDGTVHILDCQGNQVKEFAAHTATVNDLSFDLDGEYIGSCSDDGSVVVNSLFTDERVKFEYRRPMKAVALDPDYARKTSKRFSAGGLAGELLLNTKGWLGYRDQVLHSGEGPIHAVKWRSSLLAWANDIGVKIYDIASNQRITFIARPDNCPRAELLQPHLVWQDETLLVIGWGTSVKIAAIRSKPNGGTNATDRKYASYTGAKHVDIVAVFQTTYFISGLAPYGDALVILAYIPDREDGENEVGNAVPSRQGYAQRPEVHIVTWKNEDLATDELPINGFEHFKAKDYLLAHASFSGTSGAGGQWAPGEEPLYYIVFPKGVIIAKPRDADDHIAWLLQHQQHDKALAAIEAGKARLELLDEVGSKYLHFLVFSERQYAKAAALCPKLLHGSATAWERWVFEFCT